MDLADEIAKLAQRAAKQKDVIETEEATKNALIMPFLSALGYDVFDPTIVVPEFTADVGVKKGEKVDYAIKQDGKVIILIECKPCKSTLSTPHASQLFRYFTVTEARFAILTNGIQYWFFTDLDQQNKMDAKPFFEFDILDYRGVQIDELKKFEPENFDVNAILATASDLKYNSALIREINAELSSPSDEIARMFIRRVYDGQLTANVMTKFAPLVQRAMTDAVRELVNQRLSSALDVSSKAVTHAAIKSGDSSMAGSGDENGGAESVNGLDGVVTTDEEQEGYQIIRAIVREVASVNKVVMRDAKSYCAVLYDDNNRKPICRLHFNAKTKYLGLFDEEKAEERVTIDSLDDIFVYADRLKSTVARYL